MTLKKVKDIETKCFKSFYDLSRKYVNVLLQYKFVVIFFNKKKNTYQNNL